MKDKISLISRNKNYYKKIQTLAKQSDIKLEIVNPTNLEKVSSVVRQFGELVFYRNSSLGSEGRSKLLREAMKQGKTVINEALVVNPMISDKLYQQDIIKKNRICGIPSYRFKDLPELIKTINQENFSFPLIAKKRVGSKGKDVLLISQCGDFREISNNYSDYLFQPFIKNKGDYRVFIAGEKVIGIARRVAKRGEFRNNLSQGGTASLVKNPLIIDQLSKMALKIHQLFNLQFSGIDIIRDEDNNCYRFMEINLSPGGWHEFDAVGLNINQEILNYLKRLISKG